MADLTPEENENLMSENEGVVFDEAQRYAETGTLDDIPYATVETIDTLLTEDQRRRVEALLEARNLLTSEVARPATAGFLGAIGAGTTTAESVDAPTKQFAGDLVMLADYILQPASDPIIPTVVWAGENDTREVRVHGEVFGGVVVMPGAPSIPEARVQPFVCDDPSCLCATGGLAIKVDGAPDEVRERIESAFRTEFGNDNVQPINIDREEG